MNDIQVCPECLEPVETDDYYCSHCGAKLHQELLSTSLSSQLILYLKSLLLPPLGFFWGYKYLKQDDQASKIVGFITIGITVLIILITASATITYMHIVNAEINTQFSDFQGF